MHSCEKQIRRFRLRRLMVLVAVALGVGTAYATSAVERLRVATGDLLGQRLESLYQPVSLVDGGPVAGIVVLGGGIERVKAALGLALRFPAARVILSGAGQDERQFLAGGGQLAGRLTVDQHAKNTYENALISKRLASPKASERWLLVTTALHMPRSIATFRAAGFDVEPWPVNDAATSFTRDHVEHEILGLLYYRLLGRA